jgi:hypothetical protein
MGTFFIWNKITSWGGIFAFCHSRQKSMVEMADFFTQLRFHPSSPVERKYDLFQLFINPMD